MNQIIKTETIDFNALIKSNTTLTINGQSNMIDILKKEFTEEELHWFIVNLLIYMNYHPTEDFPINLSTLVKLVGFSHKKNAKRTLENNFILDQDYKVLLLPKEQQVKTNGGAGLNKEQIMLNIDTFKNMCMLVKTDKSKEIRRYYVKLENIYNKIVKEEIENTKLLLQEKDTQLLIKETSIEKLIKDKALERHYILLREFATIGCIVYVIKVKSYDNGYYIIKIGESRVGILDRYKEHKSNYEEAIILDCFLVQNSKDFEKFLHNQFKKHKVKNLINHENENELFLIGKELSYVQVTDIINQNIKYYNDNHVEIEKLRLENDNLIKIQELNNNQDNIKSWVEIMANSNKLLLTKIDNLENKIDNLENQMSKMNHKIETFTAKTTNNFNEQLATVGPYVQQINSETLQLIKVYESASQCLKENSNIKRSSLNKAVVENTIYQGFRWLFVDRSLDANTIYDIKNTKETRVQNIGYIAKLNSDKTNILKIYLDRKTASKLNGYVSSSSLDTVVKKCKLSNGNYYILYNELSLELRNKYIKPILYKNGVGKFDIDNNLIKEFLCKEDCRIKENISNKSLTKALETTNLYNNFYYKFINEKLEC